MSGVYNEHIQWRIEEETLILSGEGPMISSDQMDTSLVRLNPWMYQHGGTPIIRKVVIEEGITSIGDGAFQKHAHLERVVIANSVTSIHANAFYSCNALKEVILPANVREIGRSAFSHCAALTSVAIPDSVEDVGRHAFGDTPFLKVVQVKAGLVCLGRCAYHYLGTEAAVRIPEGVKTIAPFVFADCKQLTAVHIPDSVVKIGASAFTQCHGLRSITIPESVVHIGHAAFKDCKNLSEVRIHLDTTAFYPSTFEGTTWLRNCPDSVIVNETLIAAPNHVSCFTVPQNVKTIAMSSIKGKPIKELVIPQSVENIEEFACSSCEALEVLRLPEQLPMFKPAQYTPIHSCPAVKRIYYGEGKYLAVDGIKCMGVAGENVLWIQQNNGIVSIFGNGTVDLHLVIRCIEEEYADFGSYFTFRYAWESSDVEIYKGVKLSEPLPTTLPPESLRNRFSCYDIETKTCYFTVSHRNYIVSAGETTIA